MHKKVVYAPNAVIYHDHRATLNSLMRQSVERNAGFCYLMKKWPTYPPKKFSTSVWECCDIFNHGIDYVKLALVESDPKKVSFAKFDFLDRCARKWGNIVGVFKTGQFSRW
jgi:hypothetical protein